MSPFTPNSLKAKKLSSGSPRFPSSLRPPGQEWVAGNGEEDSRHSLVVAQLSGIGLHEMHRAAVLGQVDTILAHLSGMMDCLTLESAKMAIWYDDEKSPWLLALAAGSQKLIKIGTRFLDIRDKMCRTPLFFAVLGDAPRVLEVLLKAGARVDASDSHGRTAVHVAVLKRRPECLRILLNWSQRSSVAGDREGVTPIHLATTLDQKDDKNLILPLLRTARGVSLDQLRDKDERTPLHWACAYANPRATSFLLSRGCSPALPDRLGRTPLLWACAGGSNRTETLKLVLSKTSCPALLNWQDSEGKGVLHLSLRFQPLLDELLKRKNVDVAMADSCRLTPLHWAAGWGLADACKSLLRAGAPWNVPDSDGLLPLHYASIHDHSEVVSLFLDHPGCKDLPSMTPTAPPNEMTTNGELEEELRTIGESLVSLAKRLGNEDIAELLIAKGGKEKREEETDKHGKMDTPVPELITVTPAPSSCESPQTSPRKTAAATTTKKQKRRIMLQYPNTRSAKTVRSYNLSMRPEREKVVRGLRKFLF
ncbi:unnamed protein product, partial [Cyprideis torosa]